MSLSQEVFRQLTIDCVPKTRLFEPLGTVTQLDRQIDTL